MLLSGKSMDGLADTGPIVCACFGVGRNTICDTIAGGARSAADIGAKLKAGTNCGSCIPELKRLIAQTATRDPEQRKLAAANSVGTHVIASEATTNPCFLCPETWISSSPSPRACGADGRLLR